MATFKYNGNPDFRGWLAGNGYQQYLAYTGNDGKVNQNDLQKALYGTGNFLGDTATSIRAAQSAGNHDANATRMEYAPSIVSGLYKQYQKEKSAWDRTRGGDGRESGVGDIGYGGVGTGPARDYAAEGFLESGISQTEKLIDSLGGREKNAIGALIDSYNRGRQRQLVSYKDNESDYTKNSDRVVRENARKKSEIDNSVRNNMTALQRLLGSRGAGSSSAAQYAVPTAVAAQGTSQRADATQTFVDNKDTLDTNWSRYRREFDQAKEDSKADLENNRRDVRAGFAEQGINARQKLQELLANLAAARSGDPAAIDRARSVTSQINELQEKLTSYAQRAKARVIKANDPRYTVGETQAMAETDINSAQQPQNPVQEEAGAYYGDVKEMSDEELLRQLYGDPNYQR